MKPGVIAFESRVKCPTCGETLKKQVAREIGRVIEGVTVPYKPAVWAMVCVCGEEVAVPETTTVEIKIVDRTTGRALAN